MSLTGTADATLAPRRYDLDVVGERLTRFFIALVVFLGGFVIEEPAPYELLLLVCMVLFIALGMRLSQVALALAGLFALFNFGGVLSMLQMPEYKEAPLYLAVSAFLGLSSVFFVAVVEKDASRLSLIFKAYIAAAVITAFLGVVGYFDLFPGSRVFTLYDRAKGAFQDPNVFGPFLILPTLYLVHQLVYGSWRSKPTSSFLLFILFAALFLSFSRAAWGLTVLSGAVFYTILILAERSPLQRMRLVMIAIMGLAALTVALLIALQFEVIGDMFEQRARAVQDYDGGAYGRFARHAIGFEWALTNPFGIGPLEFGLTLGADPHNIWVKSLMAYGWLGFFSYLAITIFTLAAPFRLLFRDRPWQIYLQCAYATFVGHIIIAYVIDIDHWRHVYLIIGLIWGCVALEFRHNRAKSGSGQISA